MREELVKIETAKFAKELQFNEGVGQAYVDKDGEISVDYSYFVNNARYDYSSPGKTFYAAPTQDLLRRWLREKHQIHIDVPYLDDVFGYYYIITTLKNNTEVERSTSGSLSHEAVLESALFNALNLVKYGQ
jgi:hypothetical protein